MLLCDGYRQCVQKHKAFGNIGSVVFGRSVGGCIALHDTPITFDGLVLGLIMPGGLS
jgi:hypothetical protein